MLKELFLSITGGLFGFVEAPKRDATRLEERERQVLFVQRENNRQEELCLQQEERRRQQAFLRRRHDELYQKQEEINRLAYQQNLLRLKKEELDRQQELLVRQRNATLARQQAQAGSSHVKISSIL